LIIENINNELIFVLLHDPNTLKLNKMKYLIILAAILVFSSCRNYKKETERLETKVDSLRNVTVQKDSTIENFVNDFAEIQANLDSIKKMERLMPETGEEERNLTTSQRNRILNDIGSINNLLAENEKMIASMKQQLSNSNVKSGRLQKMVADLEEQSRGLQESLQNKDTEIGTLSQQVQEQTENIGLLKQQLDEMTAYNTLQSDTLKMRTTALNTAYYAIGTVSELRDEGIIERQGGILGIGSTPVVRRDIAPEPFEEVDIRQLEYLPLNAKKANVVSVHPPDSYHIAGEQADTLYIEDPERFWSASRYLVVAIR
jgi:peptidoglycan hydrolase CwlO-like protein